MRCRYKSGRVPVKGVFVGARVVRGGDWRWGNQDGSAGKEGTVLEIEGWHSESSVSQSMSQTSLQLTHTFITAYTHIQRSVAVVEWRESALKRKYRLGHKGKVGRSDDLCKILCDVRCV